MKQPITDQQQTQVNTRVMKRMLYTLVILLVGFTTSLQAQNFESSTGYYSYILAEQARVINKSISYMIKSIHDHKAMEDNQKRESIIRQLDNSISRVQSLPAFEGDASLKKAALEVLSAYKMVYSVKESKADSIQVEEKSGYEVVKAYFDARNEIEEELLEIGKKFTKTHKAFAKKHGIKKEERQEALYSFATIAQINHYCRDIYLEYVKLSDINKDFFKAMKKRQQVSMEEHRNQLIEQAHTALAKLEKMNGFEGERNYLDKAFELINYFKNIADSKYTELVSIAAKKNATFEDANQFNKIIISNHRDTKALLKAFDQESAHLMNRFVSHESEQQYALDIHNRMDDILANLDLREYQQNPSYHIVQADGRVMPIVQAEK